MQEFREVPSPIRRYTQLGWKHRFRHWYWKGRLAALGEATYIDKRVAFDRFPGNVHIGSNVILKEGIRICPTQPDSRVVIGDWTSVGYSVYAFAATAIEIGRDCMIGPFSYLVDNHHLTDRSLPMRQQALKSAPIVIEDDVWLGAHCVILAGVRIGKGSVISAGSVVFQDVPPYSVAAGSPARVIGQR